MSDEGTSIVRVRGQAGPIGVVGLGRVAFARRPGVSRGIWMRYGVWAGIQLSGTKTYSPRCYEMGMRSFLAGIVGTAALGLLACSSGTRAGGDAGRGGTTDSCRLIMALTGEVRFQSSEGSVSCSSANNVAPELLAI